MRIKLHNRDFIDMMVDRRYATTFYEGVKDGLTERTYSGKLLGLNGSYREVLMDNIHIGYGNLLTPDGVNLAFDSDVQSVEMHFALTGVVVGREIDQKYNFEFQGGQHNLFYANGLRGEVYYPVNAPVQTFEVNMTTDFIRRYLPPDDPVFRDFRKALGGSRFAYLSQQHLPITAPMLTIIQDILANNQADIFRRHYLEAKVIELLMLQLEQYRDQPAGVKLSSQERDRMHAVGQHLNKHMEDVYTLTTLAQTFGTNEYALKRNFKKVFGTTVFTYWTQAKMETARGLLLAEGLPVKEVAYRVGYKNPQHFSSAFKRYFGYSPSQLFCG